MTASATPIFIMRAGTDDEIDWTQYLTTVAAGTRFNLTGYTIKTFIALPNGNTLTITNTAVDLPNGEHKTVFIPANLVAGDGQVGFVEYTSAGGDITTTNNFQLNVLPR